MQRTTTAILLMGLAGSAMAAPGFDRPGTSFNPEVLAPGSIAWEQGLPDITKDKSNGITTTRAQYDTRLRFGFARHFEAQVYSDIYNILTQTYQDNVRGSGNTGIAIKANLPTQNSGTKVGIMAAVDFNSGKSKFRNTGENGKPARAAHFGVTSSWELNDTQSFALYGDITRIDKNDVYTFSPSWSIAINDTWGAYAEYKVSFGDLPANDNLAGGGVTWMATNKMQLDFYSNFGLTDDSTDLEAGFGLSYLFR